MTGVRVLVGTRKGAFVLTSDGKRRQWEVSEPQFGGWEIYHFTGSPVEPARALTSGTTALRTRGSSRGSGIWSPPPAIRT
jgi:hypothetical protein